MWLRGGEEAGHVAVMVRKQKVMDAGVQLAPSFSPLSIQFGALIHEVTQPTFRTGLPFRLDASGDALTEVCLLGGSKSCQADSED